MARYPEGPHAPPAGPVAPPVSERLRLEVELSAVSEPLPAPPHAGPGGAHTVLLAIREPDLRAYVRDCLRERPALHVREPHAGEIARDAALRLRAELLIAELPAPGPGLAAGPPQGPVPLLLIPDRRGTPDA
jgi:hypothetical protein